jgi:glutaconate CoA-transferase subunit A
MKALKAYADAAKDPGDWTAVQDRFVGADEAEATLPGSAERRR